MFMAFTFVLHATEVFAILLTLIVVIVVNYVPEKLNEHEEMLLTSGWN